MAGMQVPAAQQGVSHDRGAQLEAATRRTLHLRRAAQQLALDGEEPGYVQRPKQFLAGNVFAERCQIPACVCLRLSVGRVQRKPVLWLWHLWLWCRYTIHQSGHAYSAIFYAKTSIPWLVNRDCGCGCGAGRGMVEAEWSYESAIAPTDKNCFCHIAYGYGVAASRKEAEQNAALDVCTRLHRAGLLTNLQVHGQDKVARDQSLERGPYAARNEVLAADWFQLDPKDAILNFVRENSLTLEFINETKLHTRQNGCTMTALLTFADGSQLHRRASRKSRKEAEKDVSLQLCEHPGIARRLRRPLTKRAKRTRDGLWHGQVSESSIRRGANQISDHCVNLLATQWPRHTPTAAPSHSDLTQPLCYVTADDSEGDSRGGSKSHSLLSEAIGAPTEFQTGTDGESSMTTAHANNVQLSYQTAQMSVGCSPSFETSEWFAHNPKLYLLRYTQQYSVQLGWDRTERGPTTTRDFSTTLTVPLPPEVARDADKHAIVKHACCRTKKLADYTVALVACRHLACHGLLQDPALEKQKRRSKHMEKSSSSLVASAACSHQTATAVRIADAPVLMRTPHLRGSLMCSQKHPLTEPVVISPPPTFREDIRFLNAFFGQECSSESTLVCKTEARPFCTAYHADPSLSPSLDQTKWVQLDPLRDNHLFGGPVDTARMQLPVFALHDKMVESIRSSEVVIVHGPPGVGKTTQLSQFIMSDWERAEEGLRCSVVHCLPDSNLVVAMADRVAKESADSKASVGFHTMLAHKIPVLGANGGPRTIFTTADELVRRLQYDPFLADATHVIVDEIENGSQQLFFLLTVLKILAYGARRKSLRLVVVTAEESCRAQMVKYFDSAVVVDIERQSIGSPCTHYLEDIIRSFNWMCDKDVAKAGVIAELEEEATVDLSLIIATVAHIGATTVDGGILIFLPTADLVISLCTTLGQLFPHLDTAGFCVAPLHRSVPADELQLALRRMDPGIRKIVVATSVAELETTVQDVRYVIDSGRTQEHCGHEIVFCHSKQCERRAWRASQCEHEPEKKTAPLEEAILAIRLMKLGGIKQFLSLTPEPPPTSVVADAVRRLHYMRALSSSDDQLTPLGRMMAQIPFLTAQLRKFLLVGALFNLREDALTIAAALSVEPVLVLPTDNVQRAKAIDVHRSFCRNICSDHQQILSAYNIWASIRSTEGDIASARFCSEHYLSEINLTQLSNIRSALDVALASTNLRGIGSEVCSNATMHDSDDALLRAALTVSFQPNVLRVVAKHGAQSNFYSQSNCCVVLHPNSVNFGRAAADIAGDFLVYMESTRRKKSLLAQYTTVASPLSLLVLNSGCEWQRVETPRGPEVVIDGWARFLCPQLGTYEWLHSLRHSLDRAMMQAFASFNSKQDIDQRALQTIRMFSRSCVWMDGCQVGQCE